MNRLLLLPLLLLACTAAAQQPVIFARNPAFSAPAACATTQTTNVWDDLLEGFQDVDGYDNTWTQVGTTANITAGADSSALTTGKAPGQCAKAWKLIVPTDGTETFAYWDYGSSVNLDSQAMSVTCNLYIESAPLAADNYVIFSFRGTAIPGVIGNMVLLQNVAGVVSLNCWGQLVTVSAGQWYTVKITLATTAASSTFEVWSQGSLTGSATVTRDTATFRYLFMGATRLLETDDSGTLWFDTVAINTP